MLESVVYLCRDCQHPMDVQYQDNGIGGYITLVTCWCSDCLLNAVTLSVNQYAHLTETELANYREMNSTSRTKYAKALPKRLAHLLG